MNVLTPSVEKKSPETKVPPAMLAEPWALKSMSRGPAKAAMPEKASSWARMVLKKGIENEQSLRAAAQSP
ncbi:MAG TPA: hypothetical protein VMF66_08095 [Candidatus Acidoferrum sp.]|nr:hypothetical protein [Candidatus Acidoferrum sp.]